MKETPLEGMYMRKEGAEAKRSHTRDKEDQDMATEEEEDLKKDYEADPLPAQDLELVYKQMDHREG